MFKIGKCLWIFLLHVWKEFLRFPNQLFCNLYVFLSFNFWKGSNMHALDLIGHVSQSGYRTCGPMDKAPAYGAGDSRFDPWHVQ